MTDSTPRRTYRAKARASRHGEAAEQLPLAVDERPSHQRLYAAVRWAYDRQAGQVAAQQRRAER